jgi:hypothetical protein
LLFRDVGILIPLLSPFQILAAVSNVSSAQPRRGVHVGVGTAY